MTGTCAVCTHSCASSTLRSRSAKTTPTPKTRCVGLQAVESCSSHLHSRVVAGVPPSPQSPAVPGSVQVHRGASGQGQSGSGWHGRQRGDSVPRVGSRVARVDRAQCTAATLEHTRRVSGDVTKTFAQCTCTCTSYIVCMCVQVREDERRGDDGLVS